ncbi:MAG TPA: DUF1730 domain-containing protein [Elusimicrobiales bacterium]|nr:DUF1730 domain-containing protein [Elusimicrobiales bacterium]
MRNEPIEPRSVRTIALKRGASDCGLIRAGEIREHARFLSASADAPPGLSYLRRGAITRRDPRLWFPPAKSVLVCAFRYWSPERGHPAENSRVGAPEEYLAKSGRRLRTEFLSGARSRGAVPLVSRYALGPDYHDAVKEKLSLMLSDIKELRPDAEGKAFADTSPVLEKELGRLAGLGFRGRNTLLVSPEYGSYFFIGGLALSLDITEETRTGAPETAGGCGECGKCVDACPTGALNGDGSLDAGKCLSYWNTQSRTEAPADIVKLSGGYIYGCDICQEACPYNGKDAR